MDKYKGLRCNSTEHLIASWYDQRGNNSQHFRRGPGRGRADRDDRDDDYPLGRQQWFRICGVWGKSGRQPRQMLRSLLREASRRGSGHGGCRRSGTSVVTGCYWGANTSIGTGSNREGARLSGERDSRMLSYCGLAAEGGRGGV